MKYLAFASDVLFPDVVSKLSGHPEPDLMLIACFFQLCVPVFQK